jgi:hypothetical protein
MLDPKFPFDHVTSVGTAFVACTYDVDIRTVRGEVAALRLVAEVRERVRAGRALRPDAAHYVDVIASDEADDVVRSIVLSQLGEHDGVDGVRTSRPPPCADAARVDPNRSPSSELAPRLATEADPGWAWLAEAFEADNAIVGRVVSLEGEDAQVDVGGAVGNMCVGPGERSVRVGDQVRVRVVMLNLARRRAELVPATEETEEE